MAFRDHVNRCSSRRATSPRTMRGKNPRAPNFTPLFIANLRAPGSEPNRSPPASASARLGAFPPSPYRRRSPGAPNPESHHNYPSSDRASDYNCSCCSTNAISGFQSSRSRIGCKSKSLPPNTLASKPPLEMPRRISSPLTPNRCKFSWGACHLGRSCGYDCG